MYKKQRFVHSRLQVINIQLRKQKHSKQYSIDVLAACNELAHILHNWVMCNYVLCPVLGHTFTV